MQLEGCIRTRTKSASITYLNLSGYSMVLIQMHYLRLDRGKLSSGGIGMNRKICLLTLTVCCFPCLVSTAYAGEPEVECNGTACGIFLIHGGPVELERTPGLILGCTSFTGTGNYTSKTTGTIQLTFHGCEERLFGIKCGGTGTVTSTVMAFHNVYLTHAKVTPGMLITGVNLEFSCFFNSQVTGDIIAHLESGCTVQPGKSLPFNFERTQPGHQKYTQVTGTGQVFDLVSSMFGGPYETTSMRATGTATLPVAPTVTCP